MGKQQARSTFFYPTQSSLGNSESGWPNQQHVQKLYQIDTKCGTHKLIRSIVIKRIRWKKHIIARIAQSQLPSFFISFSQTATTGLQKAIFQDSRPLKAKGSKHKQASLPVYKQASKPNAKVLQKRE